MKKATDEEIDETLGIDIIDYLLLDYLESTPLCVSPLGGREVDQWVNKPHHGLDINELAERLYRLLQKNLIFAKESKRGRVNLTWYDFYTQLKEKKRFSERRNISIGMASLGAELWERKFKPDWSKFNWGSSIDLEDKLYKWFMVAQDKSLLKKIFEIYSHCYIPVPDTIVWDKIAPWQAYYWKTLPFGYRVSYNSYTGTSFHFPEDVFRTLTILTTWRRKWGKNVNGSMILIEPKEQIKLNKQWRKTWREQQERLRQLKKR